MSDQIAQATSVATQFVAAYYNAFDGDRGGLAPLFKDISVISFEGDNVKGGNAFLQKLTTMGIPPGQTHRIVTVDAQPSCAGAGALIVFVCGDFCGQKFQEVFQLVPDGVQKFYIHNDIFRVGTANAFNAAEASDLCRQFMTHYFTTYDGDRSGLRPLYRPNSVLTFEGDLFVGTEEILQKISESPKVTHDGASITLDAHCVNGLELVLVFISGKLTAEGSDYQMGFTQTMTLVKEPTGQYYVGNDIFRLNIG